MAYPLRCYVASSNGFKILIFNVYKVFTFLDTILIKNDIRRRAFGNEDNETNVAFWALKSQWVKKKEGQYWDTGEEEKSY